MRQNFIYFSIFSALILFQSCHDHDSHNHDEDVVSEYSISINSPSASAKTVGDTLFIDIDFEEEHEETVHHINVEVFNALDSTIVYAEPVEAHIHATSGFHNFLDQIILTTSFANKDWVLQAKVWGHDDGIAEISEKINFHVNP